MCFSSQSLRLFILLFLSLAVEAFAGGPKKIAKIDRSLWPYTVDSPREFDFASQMEALVFANVLQWYEALPEDSLKKYLGLQKINLNSVLRWQSQSKNILLANINTLQNDLPHQFVAIKRPAGWETIVSVSKGISGHLSAELKAWYGSAHEFYESYLYEQLRLAALFPRTTSEILSLHDNEITGYNYPDKCFLLTFDDGPTAEGGNTDKLISTLNSKKIGAIFFVLGDMLDSRLKRTSFDKVQALYENVVVGSHGRVHVQHPKYDNWEASLSFTRNLIAMVSPVAKDGIYFRPPYGQRHDAMVTWLTEHHDKVMLWNIDAQDWNAKITPNEIADRVITLMLLWRRGVILFHDIHPKANIALPQIWTQTNGSGLVWVNPATPMTK